MRYLVSVACVSTEQLVIDSHPSPVNERSEVNSIFDPNLDFDADVLGKQAALFSMHRIQLMCPSDEDSPYVEVRSAVANFDDPDMPVSTIRAWALGIICTILLAGINQVMVYRFPSIVINNASTFVFSSQSVS